ncbi:hypothetical protein ANRL2_02702 [Anaerolineae bacterium]|nr:hypothetical protein ANRL2_02702 [Anaerolineae bacterium]
MSRSFVVLLLLCVPLFLARSVSPQAQDVPASGADAKIRLVLSEVVIQTDDNGNPTYDKLRIFGAELGGAGITLFPSNEFDLSTSPNQSGAMSDPSWRRPFVLAAGESRVYLMRRLGENSNDLKWVEPFNAQSKPKSLNLKTLPVSALIEVAGKLYLGLPGEVRVVDCDAKSVEATEFYKAKKTYEGKTVDAFARCGEMIVAIDDVVTPKYAYVFKRTDTGMTFAYEADLPNSANSQYYEAVGDGTRLAVLAHFGLQGGYGTSIDFFEVDASKMTYKRDVREGQSWDERDKPSTLVGEKLTGLSGMAFIENGLIVGAGERGIIFIPNDKDAKATQIGTKGSCTDLLLKSGRVFALVQVDEKAAAKSELVEYEILKGGLKEQIRHKLERRATDFAH